MSLLHIFCTVLPSPLIFEASISEAFPYPRHLAGFSAIVLILPKKQRGKAAWVSFTVKYSKVLDHGAYF
jgi:hypothetical protein